MADDPAKLFQDSKNGNQAYVDTTRAGTAQPVNDDHKWSKEMATKMSYTLFIFTGVVLLLATALLWKRNVTAVQIVRLFMLVLIVSLSSFLVVVGYDQSQLTPVIGLFGAICGYLLGHAPAAAPQAAAPGMAPADKGEA